MTARFLHPPFKGDKRRVLRGARGIHQGAQGLLAIALSPWLEDSPVPLERGTVFAD